MEERLKAIMLFGVDYKDDDKIVTLFSPDRGIVNAAARGVKKPKSNLRPAVQPFCCSEFILRRKGDKLSVVFADIIESFYPLREDFGKLLAGSAALEFIRAFAVEDMESGELFACLFEFLSALCYGGVRPKVAACKFLLDALGISGYELNAEFCVKCRKTPKNRAFFDFDLGGPVCESCRGGSEIELNPNTLAMLALLSRSSFEELCGRDFGPMIESKAVRLLVYFTEVKAGVKLRSAAELAAYK